MSTAELELARPCQDTDCQTPDDARLDPSAPDYFRWKGAVDRLLAALLLVPGLPLIGLLVILVRRNSPGPGIFRQIRAGRNGVTFTMYKIRTMRVDAEAATGAVWTQPGDPRITKLGQFLRKLHLDELPQLFNVLRGEMSLVGPRPERPEFVDVLAAHIPGYRSRLTVLPGVTGLAQINLPPDTDLDSVRRKQTLDLEYIRTAGPWLDARMMLCTCLRLFGCSGEHAMRLMRVQRYVPQAGDEPQDEPAEEEPQNAAASSAHRKTVVFGIGDTLTFDPAVVAEELRAGELRRAEELRAAASDGPADADPPETNTSRPATPENLRQQALASRSHRRPLARREETARSTQRSALAPREELPSRRSVTPPVDPCALSGAFTVDVEDYYHVTAFENDIPPSRWGEYPSRVVDSTRRVLDLLARHHVYGTFFVLGWVAERFPKLVEEIHAARHQIGSHGYWHRRIYQQTPDEFRADVQKSRDVLMDIIGQKVTAYRAPCFSITEQSLWALPILAEEGFEVDCSIFPIHHDRYGVPEAKPTVHCITTEAGAIWEFPPATVRVGRVNVPVSGGGYFRLLPVRLTVRWLKAVRRRSGLPFVFYIHPWELDPDQPRLPAGTLSSRARHYLNLSTTEQKLEILLTRFRFGPVEDVVAQLQVAVIGDR